MFSFTNPNGTTIAKDPGSNVWREYDPTTQKFGVVVADPPATQALVHILAPAIPGIRNYKDAQGVIHAYFQGGWGIYDSSTQTVTGIGTRPPAGTDFEPDLLVPSLIINNAQPTQTPPNNSQNQGNQSGQPWFYDPARVAAAAVLAAALLFIAVLGGNYLSREGKPGTTTQQTSANINPPASVNAGVNNPKAKPGAPGAVFTGPGMQTPPGKKTRDQERPRDRGV